MIELLYCILIPLRLKNLAFKHWVAEYSKYVWKKNIRYLFKIRLMTAQTGWSRHEPLRQRQKSWLKTQKKIFSNFWRHEPVHALMVYVSDFSRNNLEILQINFFIIEKKMPAPNSLSKELLLRSVLLMPKNMCYRHLINQMGHSFHSGNTHSISYQVKTVL